MQDRYPGKQTQAELASIVYANMKTHHPFHQHREDLVDSEHFVAIQIDIILNGQFGCGNALLSGLALTKALVYISVNNAPNDVNLLRFQFHQSVFRVCRQVDLQVLHNFRTSSSLLLQGLFAWKVNSVETATSQQVLLNP